MNLRKEKKEKEEKENGRIYSDVMKEGKGMSLGLRLYHTFTLANMLIY